jgi:hypothetical protein
MNQDDPTSTFYKIVTQYTPLLGERHAQMIQEDWAHGEAVIAFESLLDNLQELDAQVDDGTRLQLRSIAKALDMLDNERGKGIYWD